MKTKTIRRLLIAFVAFCLAAAIAGVWLLQRRGVEGFTDRASPVTMKATTDADLVKAFADPSAGLPKAAYEAVMRYVLEGYLAYRTAGGAFVHYPGLHSNNGRRSDGLEGFARMLPVAAVWLATGHDGRIDTGGGQVFLPDAIRQGLASGTRRTSSEFWGDITDYNQRIVEAADVALGLWIGREQIWKRLDDGERKAVAEWLMGALQAETYDGNWELFPLLVHRALKGLGVDVSAWDERMQTRYLHMKSFYRGNGFFFDPPHGFDFYNAWSFQYALFWLDQMDPAFDPQFIRQVAGELATFWKHLFGPNGYPMMGRSACYRMSAQTPLVTGTWLAPAAVTKGEAMRAMDLEWSFFINRQALRDGTVSQGFCGTNPEIMAQYSGPASCLWAMRSLVAAFALDGRLGLFDAPRQPMPVERADFEVANAASGWTLKGSRASGDVTLVIPANAGTSDAPLSGYGLPRRLLERLLNKPMRPDNQSALYSRHEYSTARQMVDCSRR